MEDAASFGRDATALVARRLQGERDSYKSEGEAVAEDLAKTRSRMQTLCSELTTCEASKRMAEADIARLQVNIQATKESISRLEQQEAMTAAGMAHKDVQLSQLSQYERLLEQQAQQLERRLVHVNECQQDMLKAKQDAKKAEQDAARAEQECSRLNIQIDNLRCSLDEMSSMRDKELCALRSELDTMKNDACTAIAERSTLCRQLDAAQSRVGELEGDVSKSEKLRTRLEQLLQECLEECESRGIKCEVLLKEPLAPDHRQIVFHREKAAFVGTDQLPGKGLPLTGRESKQLRTQDSGGPIAQASQLDDRTRKVGCLEQACQSDDGKMAGVHQPAAQLEAHKKEPAGAATETVVQETPSNIAEKCVETHIEEAHAAHEERKTFSDELELGAKCAVNDKTNGNHSLAQGDRLSTGVKAICFGMGSDDPWPVSKGPELSKGKVGKSTIEAFQHKTCEQAIEQHSEQTPAQQKEGMVNAQDEKTKYGQRPVENCQPATHQSASSSNRTSSVSSREVCMSVSAQPVSLKRQVDFQDANKAPPKRPLTTRERLELCNPKGLSGQQCQDCLQVRLTFLDRRDNMNYCKECWVNFYGELPATHHDESSFLPEDAPRGHKAHGQISFAGARTDPYVHFRFKTSGQEVFFQTTVNAAGSRHAAEVIARACWMKFEQGWTKPDVLDFRNSCYKRSRQASRNNSLRQQGCNQPREHHRAQEIGYQDMQLQPRVQPGRQPLLQHLH
eukprot:TRINITY_DN42702_c0_g1_i1.p1 TRINITY_DN42702_c0_g1~~TRINITY_DN42702_c0_g1_i1.p1  ORF type:complete len:735 (-),score=145.17 TRINITY_DN42702_c0_g1_i1:145-2349(-)